MCSLESPPPSSSWFLLSPLLSHNIAFEVTQLMPLLISEVASLDCAHLVAQLIAVILLPSSVSTDASQHSVQSCMHIHEVGTCLLVAKFDLQHDSNLIPMSKWAPTYSLILFIITKDVQMNVTTLAVKSHHK